MFIETETTPNPTTLKFLPGRAVMPAKRSGTRDFVNRAAADASPLASALFDLGNVIGVLFGRDFVAVTAAKEADWSALKPQVVGVLLDHFIGDVPLFTDHGHKPTHHNAPADEHDADYDPADEDIVAQVLELIETRVRPAVANDGGDVTFRAFREGVVYLAMKGACSGCPSSTATLKNGIESLIRHYVPEVSEVRAI